MEENKARLDLIVNVLKKLLKLKGKRKKNKVN